MATGFLFNNGWILQWGFSWNPTFPVTFTRIVRCIANGTQWGYVVNIKSLSSSNIIFNQWQSANGANITNPVYWFAIGY